MKHIITKFNSFVNESVNSKPLSEILPSDKLIELLQSIKFRDFDSQKITKIEYMTKTYNPFDVNFSGTIYANPAIITFSRTDDNKYEVRIANNDGWIGGISFGSWEYIFEINDVNFNEFKKGLRNAIKSDKVGLYTKYSTGSIEKIHFYGSLKEADKFAKSHGCVKKDGGYFGFYYYNPTGNGFNVQRFTERQVNQFK